MPTWINNCTMWRHRIGDGNGIKLLSTIMMNIINYFKCIKNYHKFYLIGIRDV